MTSFWSINSYESLIAWLPWVFSYLAYFLSLRLIDNSKQIKQFLLLIVLAATGVAVLGLAQHLFHIAWVTQGFPPASTFGNKNMAAHFVVLIVPIIYVFIVIFPEKKIKAFFGMILAIVLSYLLVTETRASILVVTIQTILFIVIFLIQHKLDFTNRSQLLKLFFLFLIILLSSILFLLTTSVGQNIIEIWQSIIHEISFENANPRVAAWVNSISMILDHPWGVGLGNWAIYYPLYQDNIIPDVLFSERHKLHYLHNDLLQFVIETGFFGLIMLLLIIFLVIRKIRHAIKIKDYQEKWLILGISLSIIGLL